MKAESQTDHLECSFKFLYEHHTIYDVNQRDHEGRSLLMHLHNQPLSLYEYLLELGADATAIDKLGNTVLHHYFRNHPHIDLQSIAILRTLIIAGADPRHTNIHGQLPYEMETGYWFSKVEFLASFRLAVTSCIYYGALGECGFDLTDNVIYPYSDTPQDGTRAEFCCCGYKRQRSDQEHTWIGNETFENRLLNVLDAWAPVLQGWRPSQSIEGHCNCGVKDIIGVQIDWLRRIVEDLRSQLTAELQQPECKPDRIAEHWSKITRSQSNIGKLQVNPHDYIKQYRYRLIPYFPSKLNLPLACECCQNDITRIWADYDLEGHTLESLGLTNLFPETTEEAMSNVHIKEGAAPEPLIAEQIDLGQCDEEAFFSAAEE